MPINIDTKLMQNSFYFNIVISVCPGGKICRHLWTTLSSIHGNFRFWDTFLWKIDDSFDVMHLGQSCFSVHGAGIVFFFHTSM